MQKNTKRISKFLSLVLRHQPQKIGLNLDGQGWANVQDLLEKCNNTGLKIDMPTLSYVVANNDKKRFSFNQDCTKIRANQGHSIQVNLGYQATQPPVILYHGTATRFTNSIRREGLKKRNRHHVHLSADIDTAKKVGSRHGVPVILEIDTIGMTNDGHEFFVSENGVWLTDHIPTKYIKFP